MWTYLAIQNFSNKKNQVQQDKSALSKLGVSYNNSLIYNNSLHLEYLTNYSGVSFYINNRLFLTYHKEEIILVINFFV